jgi:hypothetical protein
MVVQGSRFNTHLADSFPVFSVGQYLRLHHNRVAYSCGDLLRYRGVRRLRIVLVHNTLITRHVQNVIHSLYPLRHCTLHMWPRWPGPLWESGPCRCTRVPHFWLAASRTPVRPALGQALRLFKPEASRELNRCAMSSTSSMAFTVDHLSPRAARSVPCFTRPQTRRRVRVVEPQETPNHGCYTLWRTQRHTRTLPAAFTV